MSEIENRYHTNLLKHGFQEEAPNTSFNSIGKLYSVPRNLGEGVYWIYSQEDLYDIKIHDFHFFTDSFLISASRKAVWESAIMIPSPVKKFLLTGV